MSKNKRNGGTQAPAQRHAEGQHGQKTTDFLRKQHAEGGASPAGESAPRPDAAERQSGGKRKKS